MFDCRTEPFEGTRFAWPDVQQFAKVDQFCSSLLDIPLGQRAPLEVFGTQFYALNSAALLDLAYKARDRIVKLSCSSIRIGIGVKGCRTERSQVSKFLRTILGRVAKLNNATLVEALGVVQDCLPTPVDVIYTLGQEHVCDVNSDAYQYFHGILEWRWLVLLLCMAMVELESSVEGSSHKQFIDQYQQMMEILVRLSWLRFKAATTRDVPDEKSFHCSCVKKVWIGMLSLMTGQGSGLNFWNSIRESIAKVCAKTPMKEADSFLFKTWLVRGIAQLYQLKVTHDESATEESIVQVPCDYTIVDECIKEAVQSDAGEDQVRAFLLVLKPIITDCWTTRRHETIIALWDYFHKRLNSPFQLPKESLANMACVCRSAGGFIEQSVQRADEVTFRGLNFDTSSYKIFLSMLAFVIRQHTGQSLKTKVQIIFNRVLSKLGPAKFETMTEQAVYNVGLLLLTMMEATTYQDDYARVSKQILQLKLGANAASGVVEIAVRRIVTATLVHMALLIKFSDSNFDKTLHIRSLLQDFDDAFQKFGDRLQPTLPIIAEGMCVLFDKTSARGNFDRGEEQFISAWMVHYLRECMATERDSILNALSAIMEQRIQSEAKEELLRRLYEFILPYIKQLFAADGTTSAAVPTLAAQFTLLATGQAYAPSFLSLFGYFADNPTAQADYRLHYIKHFVQSSRHGEIDEKLMIRSWLKLALVCERAQLADISRVVYRMQEFRALCEVPEYDLCESEMDPIELFFKGVGKRYRECGENKKAQFEMGVKLHSIFQHFDGWIANPKAIVLKRILSLLAFALKECSAIFYIKTNPTCLYHIAFSHFFLPFSVLIDRNVNNELILAMGKVWHKVMEAAGTMPYAQDPPHGDNLWKLLVKWAPQFLKFKDKNDAIRTVAAFFVCRNEPLVEFVFQRFVSTYVELQGSAPKENAASGLEVLLLLFATLHTREDHGKIALFIRITAPAIFDHCLMCGDAQPSKATALELAYKMLRNIKGPSNQVRTELQICLSAFTRKHLAMNTRQFFRFMHKLSEREADAIAALLVMLREELVEAERMRGGGADQFLRNALQRLEDTLKASAS